MIPTVSRPAALRAPLVRRLAPALATATTLAVLGLSIAVPPAAATAVWSRDLYDGRAVRWQDPDYTACTASSVLQMLNVVAYRGTRGTGFRWTPNVSYLSQESLLVFERSHDTLASGVAGSDATGWRNALNEYGWGYSAMVSRYVYDDLAFTSYDAAVHAAVRAIARFGKPVGILAWAGGHAQFMTGYVVSGANPALSDAFTVQYVYITDPLRRDALRDARISNAAFRSGSLTYRFRTYAWKDSPYDDPYRAGVIAAWRLWYGRWVIVAPKR